MITDKNQLIKKLTERRESGYDNIQSTVDSIIKDVKANGDAALFKYTEMFDKATVTKETIKVTKQELEEAYQKVDTGLVELMRRAAVRIENYHMKQRRNSWIEPETSGETMGQLIRAVERVGVYVPGGKAAYPSSVLMNVIPAKIAGVKDIMVITPPMSNGSVYETTLVAAHVAGATEIYKAGGAQAVAALAYGTESVKKVDKIVGPGNIYVALAKKSVFGAVSIDSVAGPSEILIVADETAIPEYVAADLLSQAEHDEMASAVLVTTSSQLAEAVKQQLAIQTEMLERKEIVKKSLESYGAIIVVDTLEEAFELSNFVAPEHLEICVKDSFSYLSAVENAGAVFLGNFTPEPLGDYMAGPNHVLPTDGTARFFSPLSVDDFIKKTSVLSFSQKAMQGIGADVVRFAEAEGLTAHANAVRIRLDK